MSLTIKEKIKSIKKLLGEPEVITKLLSFRSFGYLLETGWFNSFKSKESVDANLKPIPWFTYAAIDFLNERLSQDLTILEFGSGNSSLFLAERVGKVVSIEHNLDWYEKILSKIPANVEMKFTKASTAEEYLEQIPGKSVFDIIIIDGIFRNECILNSLHHMSNTGVLILDDSERLDYNSGIKFLLEREFHKISLSGIAPGIFFRKCTSFFYKSNNCLGI